MKKYSRYLLPLVTFLVFVLLLVSFVVPKKVIDTYQINVTEKEDEKPYTIQLSKEDSITYFMYAGQRPIMGIQIEITSDGDKLSGVIQCSVSRKGNTEPFSYNQYSLKNVIEQQYIYIPFTNYEKNVGEIQIDFTYLPDTNELPGFPKIFANDTRLNNTKTVVNGDKIEGNIKTMYVYTHNTYPFVYDLRIILCLFLCICMTQCYHKTGGNKIEE